MIRGIDVSEHNGTINWDEVKASGIQFAMIRAGYGSNYESQDDRHAIHNMQECERLGIPYGVYLYSYAL
ncbi:MAG: GH25 family lysozyme, partial [Lachnospiraceae bacterium]|nr:GH25 family lysozyme [Lachnospiraceae bacterium]